MDFAYSIKSFEETELFGIYLETNHVKANDDCPKVWEAFLPLIEKLFGTSTRGVIPSYGISIVNAGKDTFTYWAAVDIPSSIKLPAEFSPVSIPAGNYVSCVVPSIEFIESAFAAIYSKWAPSQREYTICMETICFETYVESYRSRGAFSIYLPVKRNSLAFSWE